jgi:AmmeMemoRadiSam system protein A
MVRDTIYRYFTLDRSGIGPLKFLLEAYEGAGVMRTLPDSAHIVEIMIAPGFEEVIDGILAEISSRYGIIEVSSPTDIDTPSGEKTMKPFHLTDSDKLTLLSIARSAMEKAAGSTGAGAALEDDSASETLKTRAGAFVSLHKKGRLRGCIGRFEAEGGLSDTVAEMAVAASQNDPRFPSVTLDETDDIDIEISVLSPLRRISDVSEIEVGAHGLFIIRDMRRGTLLPQVASERGWDTETFLGETCVKAGLKRDAWRDEDTEIYVYDAVVFGEGPGE